MNFNMIILSLNCVIISGIQFWCNTPFMHLLFGLGQLIFGTIDICLKINYFENYHKIGYTFSCNKPSK